MFSPTNVSWLQDRQAVRQFSTNFHQIFLRSFPISSTPQVSHTSTGSESGSGSTSQEYSRPGSSVSSYSENSLPEYPPFPPMQANAHPQGIPVYPSHQSGSGPIQLLSQLQAAFRPEPQHIFQNPTQTPQSARSSAVPVVQKPPATLKYLFYNPAAPKKNGINVYLCSCFQSLTFGLVPSRASPLSQEMLPAKTMHAEQTQSLASKGRLRSFPYCVVVLTW
jgi:hypothetical protein